jgi:hypothetical protein
VWIMVLSQRSAVVGRVVQFVAVCLLIVTAAVSALGQATPASEPPACKRTISARVAALETPIYVNRLGAFMADGMIYALLRDVVPSTNPTGPSCDKVQCQPGHVMLRAEKRPRPIVLRANQGDCLSIALTNLVSNIAPPTPLPPGSSETYTRNVGIHVTGMELVNNITDDSSWVGQNANSLTAPGGTNTYTYFAKAQGNFLLYSFDDGDPGQWASGLFGAVNVQPEGAEWYRSQVTHDQLHLATYNKNNLPPNMTLQPDIDPKTKKQLFEVENGVRTPLYILTTRQLSDRHTVTQAVVILTNDDYINTTDGHPVVNYDAVDKNGVPILNMLMALPTPGGPQAEIVHSDLTAIITGPYADRFPYSTNGPEFHNNPALPDRRQPYREFNVFYHVNGETTQAFPQMYASSSPLSNMLGHGKDSFGINYGMGGIGSEILANRLNRGSEGSCVECKFEEFFLTSWVVGDPAMIVPPRSTAAPAPEVVQGDLSALKALDQTSPHFPEIPGIHPPAQKRITVATAPSPLEALIPPPSPIKALYPDDPSNVYHSYLRDHVTFRIFNTSTSQQHVHHQHAHQWLHTANDDSSTYLDSQLIVPGSAYTLEMVYNGSGNRNGTIGDSIFHCHFYPHFAAGMWALWRVHDVFEDGTLLDANGVPITGKPNRALPDAEIASGSPIPAVVPLPTLGMAPIPAEVQLVDNGRRAVVIPEKESTPASPIFRNPGYPFFVPAVAGHRPPHPPMDFAWKEDEKGNPVAGPDGNKVFLDGGLPRHVILSGKELREFHTRWDFTKDFSAHVNGQLVTGQLFAAQLPEEGTAVERAAMTSQSHRTITSFSPDGLPGNFTLNGLPPINGAPFARPEVDDAGNDVNNTRRYKAAVVERDVVLNKSGWHYPQQRFLTLWNDVDSTMNGKRPPEPLFFRANTGETVEFWHTNLVPAYYQLDDFQVRTPTDIIGEHIHLVKFDVLASDGAANGFNYEDGTFSPDEVRDRINAIDATPAGSTQQGMYKYNPSCWLVKSGKGVLGCLQSSGVPQVHLTAKSVEESGYPFKYGGEQWRGAQTTIQRWDTDPLLNNDGRDRTLRTVFTHDHFGPSTHQNVGLYAGLVIEPDNSKWFDAQTGQRMFTRPDGGPTSWQAVIQTENPEESYREFMLEYQDSQLGYTASSRPSKELPHDQLFSTTADYTSQLQSSCFPDVTCSAGLRQAFAQNGVALSPRATINSSSSGPWIINNPVSTVAEANLYQVVDGTSNGSTIQNVSGTAPLFQTDKDYTSQLGPSCFVNATCSKGLRDFFSSNGIKLSNKATITATSFVTYNQSHIWTISDHFGTGASANVATDQYQLISTQNPVSPNSGSGTWQNVAVITMDPGWADPSNALNQKGGAANYGALAPFADVIDGGNLPGTYSLNYRSEPVPTRVWNPSNTQLGCSTQSGASSPPCQPPGNMGDLSFAFTSIQRADPTLNIQPDVWCPSSKEGCPINPSKPTGGFFFPSCPLMPTTGSSATGDTCNIWAGQCSGNGTCVQPTDPYTPMLRAFQGDRVQVRMLVGAHANTHPFLIRGLKWLFEPSAANSGYHSVQDTGLSEHFEMLFRLPFNAQNSQQTSAADYLYQPSSGDTGNNNGIWGLLRAYGPSSNPVGLMPLPPASRPVSQTAPSACPTSAPVQSFTVDAISASSLPGKQLTYNSRAGITDPNALIYVLEQNLSLIQNGTLPVEPLILRAHAGDCISITLQNKFTSTDSVFTTAQAASAPLGNVSLYTSTSVGLSPQLVAEDVSKTGVFNVGFNGTQTLTLGSSSATPVQWYAGNLGVRNGQTVGVPVEFGSIDLLPSDPMAQHIYGLVGALIIEPKGSTVVVDGDTQTAATVTRTITEANGTQRTESFREFAVVMQDDLTITSGGNSIAAIDYRTEPLTARFGNQAVLNNVAITSSQLAQLGQCANGCAMATLPFLDTPLTNAGYNMTGYSLTCTNTNCSPNNAWTISGGPTGFTFVVTPNSGNTSLNVALQYTANQSDISQAYSNSLVGGDPQTPVFYAPVGTPVRFRMMHPGGDGDIVAAVHGHAWQEEPYVNNSTEIGFNRLSNWFGIQQFGSNDHIDMLIGKAGGAFEVPGDYMYHALIADVNGEWGLLRATPDAVIVNTASQSGSTLSISGTVTKAAHTGQMATSVTISVVTASGATTVATAPVNASNGSWSWSGTVTGGVPSGAGVRAASNLGGQSTVSLPYPATQ